MRFDSSHYMWLMRDGPALFMDLYELTMAQAYFKRGILKPARIWRRFKIVLKMSYPAWNPP